MPVNITVRIILIPLLAFGLARIGALLIHASSEDVYRKDFLADYLSARALLAGIDAYENLPEIATRVGVDPVPSHLPHPNPHPPTAILVSAPFALVEFESAALLWLVSEIVLLFAAFCVLLRTLGVRRWLLLSALMTVAVACWPVVFYELAFGQWMTLILLLMTLSWRYLRSKNDVLGGSLLGACMAIKLFGWLIVLYLLLKRRWKAAGAALLSCVAFNLIAACVVGLTRAVDYYTVIGPTDGRKYITSAGNFSPFSMGQRIVGLSPFAAIVSALAVILVIAFGLRLAQRARDFDGAFAVLVAMTAVLNPIAWPHYLVLLIFPASVYLCRAKTSVRGPLIIMIGALLTSLLFFLTIETLPRPLAVLLVYAPLLVTMTLAYLNQRSSSARPSAETAQLPAPPTID